MVRRESTPPPTPAVPQTLTCSECKVSAPLTTTPAPTHCTFCGANYNPRQSTDARIREARALNGVHLPNIVSIHNKYVTITLSYGVLFISKILISVKKDVMVKLIIS